MGKRFFAIFFLSVIVFFLMPGFVAAQRTGCPPEENPEAFVPCGGETCPCSLCDIFDMIARIIRFALTDIVPAIAALMIIIAGAMMISAYAGQSGPEMISRAKKFLGALMIGLLVIYLAWILVNLFLTSIGVAEWTGLDTWWIIECEVPAGLPSDPDRTYCGDGIWQTVNDDAQFEWCDGSDFSDAGNSCLAYGFSSSDTVTCNDDCTINTSNCEEEPLDVIEGCTDVAAVNYDPEATDDDGSCNYCGNGAVDIEYGEVCDGFNMGGETCTTLGFEGGEPLNCQDDCMAFDTSNCISEDPCGDGVIDYDAGETCDPGAPLPACVPEEFIPSCDPDTCTLTCTAPPSAEGCTNPAAYNYDPEATEDDGSCLICGDGMVSFEHGEVCDTWNTGGRTCADFGMEAGTLACLEGSNCQEFDPSGCGARIPPESGDRLWNCRYGGVLMSSLAAFDPTNNSVFLTGIWSINRIDSAEVVDGVTHWYTTCQDGWTGTSVNDGWKDLNLFASTHPDDDYIAYSGSGAFLFFSVVGGAVVINQDLCTACEGNEDGQCNQDNCNDLGDSCRNVAVYPFGAPGNICVPINACNLCGLANGDICDEDECAAIGPLCVYDEFETTCTSI